MSDGHRLELLGERLKASVGAVGPIGLNDDGACRPSLSPCVGPVQGSSPQSNIQWSAAYDVAANVAPHCIQSWVSVGRRYSAPHLSKAIVKDPLDVVCENIDLFIDTIL